MKNALLLICTILFISNCTEKKKKVEEQTEDVETVKDSIPIIVDKSEVAKLDESYFKAHGSEPIWDLNLFENQIELRVNEDTITTPTTEPITVESSNLKMYRIQTKTTELDIIIADKECANVASGKKLPYTVTISYKNINDGTVSILEGCGVYSANQK